MDILRILQPAIAHSSRFTATGIIVLLLASASLIALAPLAMPTGYSWLSNSISESAAQGLRDAWIARLGFLLFGMAVLWLALSRKTIWARGTYWMQLVFAMCMLGTAAFSHQPWLAGVPSDPFEDLLHSITATGMGFAFTFGVVVRFMQRSRHELFARLIDIVAIVAATLLSPVGVMLPSVAGLLQRVMFVVAYFWFAYEALNPGEDNRR